MCLCKLQENVKYTSLALKSDTQRGKPSGTMKDKELVNTYFPETYHMIAKQTRWQQARLDHQPLFGKGARPPLPRDADQTRESGGNRA